MCGRLDNGRLKKSRMCRDFCSNKEVPILTGAPDSNICTSCIMTGIKIKSGIIHLCNTVFLYSAVFKQVLNNLLGNQGTLYPCI